MKSTNQFDYPTAEATTFKAYRQEPPKNEHKGQLYKQVIKQQSEQERNRVKLQEQRKRQKLKQEEQSKIREEIQRKKRELEELQQKREEAMKEALVAAELAKIKQAQDRKQRVQNELKAKENEENAQFRFKDALRRLEYEREENALQERQAQQRRKANLQAEKNQRRQAAKYKEYLLTKEEQERLDAEEEQQRQYELMKNGMGRIGLHRGPVDYSKTFMHNPHFVFKSEEEGANAYEKGEEEQRRKQELSLRRRQQEEESRKRSLERGDKALEKLSRENEYNGYLRETSQQQIQYNMQRIQEGKRNQFVGIKPLTLAQMDSNKKIRVQHQFQQLFLAPKIDVYQAPASKYLIIQKKYTTDSTHKDISSIDYNPGLNDRPQSVERYYWQNKSQNEWDEEEYPHQRGILVQPTPLRVTKGLVETRLEEPSPRKEELSYSESQDDSSYA